MREMNHDHACSLNNRCGVMIYCVCPPGQQMNIELFITPNTEIMLTISPDHFFQCTQRQQQWYQKRRKQQTNIKQQCGKTTTKKQTATNQTLERKAERKKKKSLVRPTFSFFFVSLCGHSRLPPALHTQPFSYTPFRTHFFVGLAAG